MSRMIDAWHDRYHRKWKDYVNCPHCQDELEEFLRRQEERLS